MRFSRTISTQLLLSAALAACLPGCGDSAEQQAIDELNQQGAQIVYNVEAEPIWVNLHGKEVTEATFEAIAQLPTLETLTLTRTAATDAHLQKLDTLPDLETLDLSGTRVSDDGGTYLIRVDSLMTLALNNTNITDESLNHLRQMSRLRGLSVSGTKLSAEGLEELQRALPSCLIVN